ncbi:MAG TPA: alpha/beta hydrolase [Streptosporangiaceae bacterium]|nr:alpha/beta hydrolase [Streptosporangiaceae bacterium]
MPGGEVTFDSGGCAIAGTFTETADPVAAALLITGGGRTDRNADARLPGELMLRIGLDKAVAGALAEAGALVLRYDKRGVGASGGDYLRAGMDDRRADARAALAWLAARAGGLPLIAVGASEGAWYAAELAADGAVAGAVLLGCGARPAEEILFWQSETTAARLAPAVRMILKITRTDIIGSQRKRMARIKASTNDVIRDRGAAGIPGLRINARWLRDFLAYDPRPALARIKVPVLAITGGQDVQVPPQDVAAIGRLVQGPFEGHVADDLSHLFRPDPASAGPRAYRRAVRQPVDGEVLRLITTWITTHWAASPRPAAQSPQRPPHADHV